MTEGVKASWWHRLLLVLLALLLFAVGSLALYIAYDSSRITVQHYSWRNDGFSDDMLTTKCEVRIYGDVEALIHGCGEFDTPAKLIDDLVAYETFSAAMVPLPRSENSDALYAESVIRSYDLRHAYHRELDMGLAWKNFIRALGVIAIAWALLSAFFYLVIWIAHGTTRISP